MSKALLKSIVVRSVLNVGVAALRSSRIVCVMYVSSACGMVESKAGLGGGEWDVWFYDSQK